MKTLAVSALALMVSWGIVGASAQAPAESVWVIQANVSDDPDPLYFMSNGLPLGFESETDCKTYLADPDVAAKTDALKASVQARGATASVSCVVFDQ